MESKAEADVDIRVRDTADVGVWVLLPLIKALDKLFASLSSPLGGGLQRKLRQMHSPAILSKSKNFFF